MKSRARSVDAAPAPQRQLRGDAFRWRDAELDDIARTPAMVSGGNPSNASTLERIPR